MAFYTLKDNHTAQMIISWGGEEWKKTLVMADDRALKEGRSRDGILEEMINKRLDELYPAALQELKLEPLSEVQTEITDFAPDHIEFTFTFEISPRIKLEELETRHYETEPAPVTEEDIEDVLNRLRQQEGISLPVDQKPAKEGDELIIDYRGETEGKVFEGGEAENVSLVLGSRTFIPGFEEQLAGCTSGEEKIIEAVFPEVYHRADLAGKKALFHVTVHEIRRLCPAGDQEILEAAGEEYGEARTLDELKTLIRENLEYEREEDAADEAGERYLEELIEAHPFDIPERLLAEETENVYEEYLSDLQDQGIKPEDYLKAHDRTEADIRLACRKEAEIRVRKRILLTAVADYYDLQPAEDEIAAEYEDMAEAMGVTPEIVRDAADEDLVVESLRLSMAMAYLKSLTE